MRELIAVALVAALAFAVVNVVKAKDWTDAEFGARFRRAVIATERACEEMQLQRGGAMPDSEHAGNAG